MIYKVYVTHTQYVNENDATYDVAINMSAERFYLSVACRIVEDQSTNWGKSNVFKQSECLFCDRYNSTGALLNNQLEICTPK